MGRSLAAGTVCIAQRHWGGPNSARSRYRGTRQRPSSPPLSARPPSLCGRRAASPCAAAARLLRAAPRPTSCGGATPQRAGEAAWHRRARRQRGAARTLLRVAAAAGIVAAHHSSPMGGGRRGQGGRGSQDRVGAGDGGDNKLDQVLQALRQQNSQQQRLLQALGSRDEPRVRQGRQQHGGGGGGAGGSSNGASWRRGGGLGGAGATRARPGDWTCPQCGAFPCFSRAEKCFRCNAPRQGRDGTGAAGGGGRLARRPSASTYLGPVGANGSRPLLGGRATGGRAADESPTHRVPGASLAARVEAGRGQQPPNSGSSRGNDNGEAVGGQDQFQQVRNGRAARPAADNEATTKPAVQQRNSWAALAEEEDDDDACDVDDGDDGGSRGGPHEHAPRDEVRGAGDDDQGDDEVPSEWQLRAIWQSHCNAVRNLERDRASIPIEVINSVKAQRDAAERRWRAAKAPHPLHKRLRWAENELRAAEAKEASRRRELQTHLAEAAARTTEIEEKLAIDAARTERKRAALGTLLNESGSTETRATERATRVALAGLGEDVGPTLSAIIEQLGEGHREQGIKRDLQILSTTIERLEEVLRDGAKDEEAIRLAPQRFAIGGTSDDGDAGDIGDDDGGAGDGGDGDNDGRRVRRREATGKGGSTTAPRWTQPSANAPWRRAASSSAAVEEARRLVLAAAASGAGEGGRLASPSDTNDLAVAEQRRNLLAQEQMRAAIARQQSVCSDPQRAKEEDEQRRQREKNQHDELRRHQEAAAKAAADAEAEIARQKSESWANMSPEEREAAIKVREQQAAVGAQVFGTQAASQLAGLVHQAHVQERTRADAVEDAAEVEFLMRMSPEEFARWDQDRQSLL